MEIDDDELEALRRDALRYRWLREDQNLGNDYRTAFVWINPHSDRAISFGGELDSTIDAALKENNGNS